MIESQLHEQTCSRDPFGGIRNPNMGASDTTERASMHLPVSSTDKVPPPFQQSDVPPALLMLPRVSIRGCVVGKLDFGMNPCSHPGSRSKFVGERGRRAAIPPSESSRPCHMQVSTYHHAYSSLIR
jgi:hypothetical protein